MIKKLTAWIRRVLFRQIPVETCNGIVYMTHAEKCKRGCVLTLLARDDANAITYDGGAWVAFAPILGGMTLWLRQRGYVDRIQMRDAECRIVDTLRASCVPEAYKDLVVAPPQATRAVLAFRSFCDAARLP